MSTSCFTHCCRTEKLHSSRAGIAETAEYLRSSAIKAFINLWTAGLIAHGGTIRTSLLKLGRVKSNEANGLQEVLPAAHRWRLDTRQWGIGFNHFPQFISPDVKYLPYAEVHVVRRAIISHREMLLTDFCSGDWKVQDIIRLHTSAHSRHLNPLLFKPAFIHASAICTRCNPTAFSISPCVLVYMSSKPLLMNFYTVYCWRHSNTVWKKKINTALCPRR